MTTENLKAVLTEEEIGRVRHVAMIAEGAKSENPKTFSGCIVSFFYHTVLEILSIISRLAAEVVRLRGLVVSESAAKFKNGVEAQDDRVRELESEVDDYRETIREMSDNAANDRRQVHELKSKLKAWEDAPTITVMEGSFLAVGWSAKPGVYYLKPKEAGDEVV